MRKPSKSSESSTKGRYSLAELFRAFAEFWEVRQREVDTKWRRTLPFGDYVVDRWEKARTLGFGEGANIYDSSMVLGDVQVGKHTWIGPFTLLDGSGGLTIGDYCSISAGVQIYTHDSVNWAVSGGKEEIQRAPTSIGSRCYIGPNTIIAKGVTIGEGSVVGAMSLVITDIPARSRAYGNPAKIVHRSK